MEELNNFKKYLGSKKRIVIKIGTQVLLNKNGKLSLAAFKNICGFAFSLISQKKEIILVSSGAIAAGKDILNINPELNNFTIPQKQAFAACGQSILMRNYNICFKKYGLKTAQILLTKEDISVRKRFTNARNTIYELLNNGVIPIINENDTVSYEEIKFSDNDHLSSLVLNLVCADLLIILSNVNGVCDKNPNLHKDAKTVKVISDINSYIKNFKETSKSLHGTGGMKSKLFASFIASSAGIDTIIASGKDKKSLDSLITGNLNGTLIKSSINKINKKKHWLLFGMEKAGEIVADEGAIIAITSQNKSLLASGVIKTKGDFKKGDGVYIVNEKGKVFSKGIANIDSNDIKKIKGLSSEEIKTKFGKALISSLVVHKDKMASNI
ncbi:MAG: glutamate 5-kinase [bacterium]